MAFREILTGGACNAGDQQSSQINQNPFKNFVNYMVTGKANINQKMEGFYPANQQGQILSPEMQFNQMNAEFERAKFMQDEQERVMNGQWKFEQANMIREHQMMDRMMEDQWRKEQEMHRLQAMEFAKNREKMWVDAERRAEEEEIKMESNKWLNDYVKLENQDVEGLEKAFADAEGEVDMALMEDQVIKEVSGNMVELMSQDPDPKFQNSQFLQFLSKLKTGEFKIENNQLLVDQEVHEQNMDNVWNTATNHVGEQNMQDVWNTATSHVEEHKSGLGANKFNVYNEEEEKMDANWKMHDDEDEDILEGDDVGDKKIDAVFDKIWKSAQKAVDDPSAQGDMEQEYKQLLESMGLASGDQMDEALAEAWEGDQGNEDEEEEKDEIQKDYRFQSENPYETVVNPLERAAEQIVGGNRLQAIMALESHLQKNPKDLKAWRLLGKLHQENDQDRKALPCFLNATNIDPKDSETLLMLGVSCTNVLDELQAISHLKNWLLGNPKYAGVKADVSIHLEGEMLNREMEGKKLKGLYQAMINTFEQARMIDPRDPNLLVSLAVLNFIAQDFKQSVILFNEALKFDPDNYSLWNKLGATLAHLGRVNEAEDAYHRALELKPNFVRVWVNLGMAHAFRRDYEEAVRFYLNALQLNPDAKHIWEYIKTACICNDRYDLVPKVKDQNIDAFRDEFELMDLSSLPDPAVSYQLQANELEYKREADQWAGDLGKFQGGN